MDEIIYPNICRANNEDEEDNEYLMLKMSFNTSMQLLRRIQQCNVIKLDQILLLLEILFFYVNPSEDLENQEILKGFEMVHSAIKCFAMNIKCLYEKESDLKIKSGMVLLITQLLSEQGLCMTLQLLLVFS